MENLTDVQVHIYSDRQALPILHRLKDMVKAGTYRYAMLFTVIVGPFFSGSRVFHSHDNNAHLLSLIGGERLRSLNRKRLPAGEKGRWPTKSAVPQELYNYDLLQTMSSASKPLTATDRLVYLVHFDILADANAHRILSLIGQSDFSQIPGWLSESLSVIQLDPELGLTDIPLRYICTQAFDLHSDLDQISTVFFGVMHESLQELVNCANFKGRIYKLFGFVDFR